MDALLVAGADADGPKPLSGLGTQSSSKVTPSLRLLGAGIEMGVSAVRRVESESRG